MLSLKRKKKSLSREKPEILTGTLRGHGRWETCLFCAVRQILPETPDTPVYRDFRLRNLPANLEDGDYDLELNGMKLTLRVRGSDWQFVDPCVPIS